MLSYTTAQIEQLTRLLYPSGRAFKMPAGGDLEKLHAALAKSEARYYEDALSILDSAIADNANFTEDDATAWEARLGIASGGSAVPLADRIKAINRKINHPGTQKARQSARYLQAQLRAAGFDVYVYENKFPDGLGGDTTKTPEQIIGTSVGAAFHKTTVHHGTTRHGTLFNNKVVNYIDEVTDSTFVIGSNYRSTFYVSGPTIETFANVLLARKKEFRQLILQLKPCQCVGFLFVNYI